LPTTAVIHTLSFHSPLGVSGKFTFEVTFMPHQTGVILSYPSWTRTRIRNIEYTTPIETTLPRILLH